MHYSCVWWGGQQLTFAVAGWAGVARLRCPACSREMKNEHSLSVHISRYHGRPGQQDPTHNEYQSKYPSQSRQGIHSVPYESIIASRAGSLHNTFHSFGSTRRSHLSLLL